MHVTTAPAVLQPLAASAVASAGRVVATLTPVAVSGPALPTWRRYSTASPSTTGSGASASVTDRSAFGCGSAEASHAERPRVAVVPGRGVAAAAAADERVAAAVAGAHHVVARAGQVGVDARTAVEHVVAAEPGQRLVGAAAEQLVRACAARRALDARDVVALAGRTVVGAAAERHLDRRRAPRT